MHTTFAASSYAKFLNDVGDTQADEWELFGARFPTEIYTRGAIGSRTTARLKLLQAYDQSHSS
jgi:hypothetical protein